MVHPEAPEGARPESSDEPPSRSGPAITPYAVAALVCGIVGAFPLALIFAVIALRRAAGGHRRDRAMAVAGVVLAALWALVIVVAILREAGKDNAPAALFDLSVGDCVEKSPADMEHVLELPKVPCGGAHEGEVYAKVPVDSADLPETSQLQSTFGDRCLPELNRYSPRAAADPDVEVAVLYPTQDTWAQGDRDVVCIAVTKGARSGSLKQ